MGVDLYGNDPSKPPGQGPGQDSRARPDLYDYFIGARLCGVYDVLDYRRVLEKMLAQGLFGPHTGHLRPFSRRRHRHGLTLYRSQAAV